MSEFWFVLKVTIGTAVLVALLQVPAGEDTVENHVDAWIRTSTVGSHISEAAHGLATVGSAAYHKSKNWLVEKYEGMSSGDSKASHRDPIPRIMKRAKETQSND